MEEKAKIMSDTILITDVISRNAQAIKEQKVNCQTEFSEEVTVQTDNYLFSIIVTNLLTNAIKYSNKGSNVIVKLYHSDGKAQCDIIDFGIGIPKEDINMIFNQFYRSNSTNHPEIKGTGLGLSLSYDIVKAHGGELRVETKEGERRYAARRAFEIRYSSSDSQVECIQL